MGREHFSVRELAGQAKIELDEALVTLWDAGIEYVGGPDDQVRTADLERAQRALRPDPRIGVVD
jgi:hypothetical protein